MSPLTETLLLDFVAVIAAMILLWAASLWLRNASIVDPFWGTGFVFVTWLAALFNRNDDPRMCLLLALTTIWGLRLSLFLFWRNWGHGEDRRYQSMRQHHGDRFWWISLGTVFLLQGVLLWFIAMPLQVAAVARQPDVVWQWSDAVGILLWTSGMFFETVGDWQLTRFKADSSNKGRVLDQGLWRYTRHPNYFGDFCVWWGIYFVAAGQGSWWTIASPLAMSLLLMKVSGVALLESTIIERRPQYAEYIRQTNAFFPWFR